MPPQFSARSDRQKVGKSQIIKIVRDRDDKIVAEQDPECGDLDPIGDDRIQIMLDRAISARDARTEMMCRAAMNQDPTMVEIRMIARRGCAEIWREADSILLRSGGGSILIPVAGLRDFEDDEDLDDRALALELAKFPCPLCHRQLTAESFRGGIRVPAHHVATPVFPFGYSGPPFQVECPASLMEATQMCAGEHAPPRCDDPGCRCDLGRPNLDMAYPDPAIHLSRDAEPQSWDTEEMTSQALAYRDPRG